MDIEQLNRTQILLLTLLVSFVTSIATGIVTVSLMGQAPQGITQTVNRIVERTVEKVVSEPVRHTAAAVVGAVSQPTASTETTVVVKDDDLAADSIVKIQMATVRLVEKGGPESAAFARGVVVGVSGVVVTDRSSTDPNLGTEVVLPSGERFTAKPRPPIAGEAVRIYDIDMTGTSSPRLVAAPLADVSKLRLGQSVIRIGGRTRDSVSVGVISSLPQSGQTLIESTAEGVTAGSLLVTIFGELIGMTTGQSQAQGATSYTSVAEISTALSAERAAR